MIRLFSNFFYIVKYRNIVADDQSITVRKQIIELIWNKKKVKGLSLLLVYSQKWQKYHFSMKGTFDDYHCQLMGFTIT